MNESQKNVTKVLERLIKLVNQDESLAEFLQDELTISLDSFAQDDGFGTEQQLDPRGDFRDDEYSMWEVQGVD